MTQEVEAAAKEEAAQPKTNVQRSTIADEQDPIKVETLEGEQPHVVKKLGGGRYSALEVEDAGVGR